MKTNLTAKFCDNAKANGAACLDVFDALTPGLCLRVTAAKKSWCFVFTPPGGTSRTRMAFGTYPATPLASDPKAGIQGARERANELRGMVEAGKDPRAALAPVVAPKTMSQLMDDRLAMEVVGKFRTAGEIKRRYDVYIRPKVGDVAVQDFRIDPHYNAVIDPLAIAGKLRMAGQVHTDLITLMNFSTKRGVIEFSRIAKAVTVDPKTVRQRFLSLDEIRAFWLGADEAMKQSTACPRMLKLCLVTGQRIGEVSGMTRDELDLGAAVWTIPASRAKNGHAHAVPLSALAMHLIRDALRLNSNGNRWVFPNMAKDGPLDGLVAAIAIHRAFGAGDFAMEKFTPHDLRRTVATQMSNDENKLGIPELYISHVLNHRSATHSSITARVYNQNTYLNEKRDALDKWGAFLAELVGAPIGLRVVA